MLYAKDIKYVKISILSDDNEDEVLPEELWKEVHVIVQEAGIKIIGKKKKCKKAKRLSEETLQVAVKKEKPKAKEKRKDISI